MRWPLPQSVKQMSIPATVRFQELQFRFWAPYRVAKRAKQRGIENRICRLGRSLCGADSVAVDVGANYGFVSLVLAQTGATVHSFEIEPRIARVLRRSTKGLPNVRVHGFGVGVEPLTRLDSVLDRADFLKVDTDGSDLSVLMGAKKLLADSHPVVVVEMTVNQQEIYDLLRDVGYRHFIGMNNETVTPGEWPANLIASVGKVSIPPR